MKHIFFSVFYLFSAALAPTLAQDSPSVITTNTTPARLLITTPIISPEIETGRMVTFRLRAANAQEVIVIGQWPNGRAAMTKDSNDIWSVTVGPIGSGVWEYSFQVDGLTMIDPGNPVIKPTRLPVVSILQISGCPPLLWDFQDVPHGTVHLHTYSSKPLDQIRRLVVYTPPGYEQKTRVKYPVLYLQHGYLPKRYAVDSAIVIDSNGRTSDQMDVVIYDPQYTPTLLDQHDHIHAIEIQ